MNTTFRIVSAWFFLILASAGYGQTSATADGEFSLQGKLTSTTGTPVADGQHTLILTVYVKGSSQVVLTETDVVTTVDGIFSTMVGDNGDLDVNASTDYELGVAVDGQGELSPRISLSSALSALTADVALNAEAVDGFSVSLPGSPTANALVALNANAKIDSSLISGSLVTSVNGTTGAVQIQGGGDLAVNTTGNVITLSFTGTGGGGLSFPFTQTLNLGAGTGFSITNTLGGTAASFANTGLGTAINAAANTGAAITATSTGSLTGAATIEVNNTAGTAINATSNIAGDAVLSLQNLSTQAGAELITAAGATGGAVFEVAANGQTSIDATVDNALDVSTTTGTAINAVTNASADAAITVQNLSADAGADLMAALNAGGNTVFEVSANGQTSIDATVDNALDVTTTTGTAINAVTTASADAALTVQNLSSGANAKLIAAVNSTGSAVLEVAANGKTTITSSAADALEVSTSAAGETALRVTGGLEFVGAAGTGTVNAGQTQVTINNALIKTNSIILLTVNGGGVAAVPLRVLSQANGSFVASVFNGVGALTANVSFSYLIINQ